MWAWARGVPALPKQNVQFQFSILSSHSSGPDPSLLRIPLERNGRVAHSPLYIATSLHRSIALAGIQRVECIMYSSSSGPVVVVSILNSYGRDKAGDQRSWHLFGM